MKRIYKAMSLAALGLVGMSGWSHGVVVPYIPAYQAAIGAATIHLPNAKPTKQIEVFVIADQATVNAEPWDGSPALGGVVGPFFASVGMVSPPDLVLCVVGLEGYQVHCIVRQRMGRTVSACMNAFECEWQVEVPRHGPFALVVADLDWGVLEGPWDLVDIVYVSDEPRYSELNDLDKRARAVVEDISPTILRIDLGGDNIEELVFDKEESLRRENPVLLSGETELRGRVRLRQSSIQIRDM